MRHRTRFAAMTDAALLVLCGAVIMLAWLPSPPPRRCVSVQIADGTIQRYSFLPDDPRLAQLRSLNARVDLPPKTSLARSRWIREVAGLYAQEAGKVPQGPGETGDEMVMPVTFLQRNGGSAEQPVNSLDLHAYWQRIGDEADRQVIEVERQLARRSDQPQTSPRILAEATQQAGFTWQTLAIALAAGCLLACALGLWAIASPPRRLHHPESARLIRRQLSTEELELVMPANWVRIRQPLNVTLRHLTHGSIIVAALVSATHLASEWH